MIAVNAETPASAWRRAMFALKVHGIPLAMNGFCRTSAAAIEVTNIDGEDHDENFPMPRQEVRLICHYMATGIGEDSVCHEWTRIYRKRLFGEEGKVGRVVTMLREWPDSPRGIVSLWDDPDYYDRKVRAPCLELMWFKVVDTQLDLHVHMRTCDCFGKLLMNINEFISVQKVVCRDLDREHGQFRIFIDSLHFHSIDEEGVESVLGRIGVDEP